MPKSQGIPHGAGAGAISGRGGLNAANSPFSRAIIAVEVHKTHMILHTQDGRHIRQNIPFDGATIYWQEQYASLSVIPNPLKELHTT